jgi:hypothetical protein
VLREGNRLGFTAEGRDKSTCGGHLDLRAVARGGQREIILQPPRIPVEGDVNSRIKVAVGDAGEGRNAGNPVRAIGAGDVSADAGQRVASVGNGMPGSAEPAHAHRGGSARALSAKAENGDIPAQAERKSGQARNELQRRIGLPAIGLKYERKASGKGGDRRIRTGCERARDMGDE